MRNYLAFGVLLLCTIAAADEPAVATAIPKFDFATAAAHYTLLADGSDKACELCQIDLLKWTNPIRGTAAGSVFFWTERGIPRAACCMYAYRANGDYAVDHELVSLTTEGIEARYDGPTVWRSEKPGIDWTAVPDAPVPAANRAARLIQMRKIATSFASFLGVPTVRQQELRLLPQPIYRYPEMAEFDGAAFAFVQTTDPEVLLLIRANLRAGQPAWEFAAARMTIVHAFLTVEDKVVWSVAWWNKNRDSNYSTRARVPFSIVSE
jgi:hypothetical protein